MHGSYDQRTVLFLSLRPKGVAMIKAHNLAKSFGSVHAVRAVSFEAENAQITGILGPNGAGKSTTLRMVYGLVQPDRGHAELDGVRVDKEPRKILSMLGALPDAHGLYPRLTARENIVYYGQLHGLRGEVLEARIADLSTQLEMDLFLNRAVAGFSQGQRMKVSIARALVHDPPNVILDEPTNGLDVMSTRAMRDLILSMKEEGRAILFSSHIMQEVSALCDRIVVIASGKSCFSGTVEELRARSQTGSLEDAFVDLIDSSGEAQ